MADLPPKDDGGAVVAQSVHQEITVMTHAGSNDDLDLSAIDRVREAHVAALNAGDAGAWAAQFADDGVQMPPNAPANIGMPMIAGFCHAMLSQFRVQFALSVDEVRIAGPWAFERGSYSISLSAGAGGPPMHETGKYITIYEKQSAETWRIARDIWNSSSPAPTM
jgi:uncharacterized protein (TIGR02246 family)